MKNQVPEIEQVKELLKNARHATMATVNDDGSPLNSPYVFLYDDDFKHIYWGSHPSSRHSKNILRTGQLFVVLYDIRKPGGLYIEAKNGHAVSGAELDVALKIHNKFRAREGKSLIAKPYYEGESPQLMWCADVTRMWINAAERRADGHLLRDYLLEITGKDLK